jgi:hypothetical protein
MNNVKNYGQKRVKQYFYMYVFAQRSLTDDDLSDFMDSSAMLDRILDEEGQKKYGNEYRRTSA